MKKYFYLVLYLLISASSLSAQAPTTGQALGGTQGEQFQQVISAPDGGYLLVGSTASQDADVAGEGLGQGDLWMLKTSATGEALWQRRYGGAGREVAAGAANATASGGFFVVGTVDSLHGDVKAWRGGQDIWVLHLSEGGDLLWQSTLGGSGLDQATGVLALPEGGCLVYGQTASADGDVLKQNGSTDIWLIRLDADGALVWSQTIGWQALEQVSAVQPATDGGFWVAGATTSNDADAPYQRGESDALLVRTDAEGQVLWAQTYGGSGDDTFSDLLIAPDGSLLLSGHTTSINGDIAIAHGGADAWLLKASPEGQVVWSQTYGGASDDLGVQLRSLSASTLVLVANAFALEQDIADLPGQQFDAWVLLLNTADGSVQKSRLLGGSGYDFARSATLNGDTLALAGLTDSNDGYISGAKGQKDGLFLRLDLDALLYQRPSTERVHAFPNPAQTVLYFDRSISGQLWSDTGVLLAQFAETAQVDLSALTAGVYFVKVTASGQMLRVIKMQPDQQMRREE